LSIVSECNRRVFRQKEKETRREGERERQLNVRFDAIGVDGFGAGGFAARLRRGETDEVGPFVAPFSFRINEPRL
jgi:hypothetical protein